MSLSCWGRTQEEASLNGRLVTSTRAPHSSGSARTLVALGWFGQSLEMPDKGPSNGWHLSASLSRPRRAVRLLGLHLRSNAALADREEIPLGSAVEEGPEAAQGKDQRSPVPGEPHTLAGTADSAQPASIGLGRVLQLRLHRCGRSSDRLSRDGTGPTFSLPAA